MLYLALIQAAVYATSPCGTLATDCAQKSPLSNLLVAPGPLLQGVSEALAVVSGMQLAYTMSPRAFPPFHARWLLTSSRPAVSRHGRVPVHGRCVWRLGPLVTAPVARPAPRLPLCTHLARCRCGGVLRPSALRPPRHITLLCRNGQHLSCHRCLDRSLITLDTPHSLALHSSDGTTALAGASAARVTV